MTMSEGSDNPLLEGLPLLGDLPDLDGASVLVRVDFNVPLRACEGDMSTVTDDFRIKAALPTLNYLIEHGAKVTACTHLGRPDGAPDAQWDLTPVREELAQAGTPGGAAGEPAVRSGRREPTIRPSSRSSSTATTPT